MSAETTGQGLRRLRDALVDQASAEPPREEPSAVRFGSIPPRMPLAPGDPLLNRIAPLCEVLYIVMTENGGGEREELVLRGVVRALSGNSLSEAQMTSLFDSFEEHIALSGREARLADLSSNFGLDRVAAEAAFTLAATLLIADNQVTEAERKTLANLGHELGISEPKARRLAHGIL